MNSMHSLPIRTSRPHKVGPIREAAHVSSWYDSRTAVHAETPHFCRWWWCRADLLHLGFAVQLLFHKSSTGRLSASLLPSVSCRKPLKRLLRYVLDGGHDTMLTLNDDVEFAAAKFLDEHVGTISLLQNVARLCKSDIRL